MQVKKNARTESRTQLDTGEGVQHYRYAMRVQV
jgi:hypothetical protein